MFKEIFEYELSVLGPSGWCPGGQRHGQIILFPLKKSIIIYCIIDYFWGGWGGAGGKGIILNIFNLSN